MSSLAVHRPHVKLSHRPPRQRKPLLPVNVTGVFSEGVTTHDLLHGSAILEVTDDDGRQPEAFYWTEAVLDAGRLVGVTIQKFADGDRHYVHLDGEPSCTCEDATYRPDRPGGCRHVNAVRQALVELAGRQGLQGVGK
jgi:hypothetical protein